ncbi:hypothetical protein CDN99_13085 [Roseateles aquatilis]|uniref:HTH cro/C1-type domain-containing protein n=1 Tax=Roseateles aquatilis TaxID=431061 RepID=A0A246JCL4_9BURK|nr:helix-turn-helix transcriptional regulator [Roseateles aquatilis]OWQ90300.1 hypothetical protein CDN99_13085 [Roseateles aquatilis]
MLNLSAIKIALAERSLSQAAVAERCGVTREAVSNWLSGESIPRPAKLKLLAQALGLELGALMPRPRVEDPIVAYRTRTQTPMSTRARHAAEDMGRHLRQLMPFTGARQLFHPPTLKHCELDAAGIQEVAAWKRRELDLASEEVPSIQQLLRLLHEFGALLVPVFWNGDREGHEHALSIYLPDSRTYWVVINLACGEDDARYWLAHELAHCLTLHALQGEAAEAFAERFAHQLLLGPSATSSRTLAEACLGHAGPAGLSSLADITKAESVFGTPIFKALAAFQRAEGGRAPSFIASTLNISVQAANELSHTLWTRPPSAETDH